MNCDTDVALKDRGGPLEALRGHPAVTFAPPPRQLPPG